MVICLIHSGQILLPLLTQGSCVLEISLTAFTGVKINPHLQDRLKEPGYQTLKACTSNRGFIAFPSWFYTHVKFSSFSYKCESCTYFCLPVVFLVWIWGFLVLFSFLWWGVVFVCLGLFSFVFKSQGGRSSKKTLLYMRIAFISGRWIMCNLDCFLSIYG